MTRASVYLDITQVPFSCELKTAAANANLVLVSLDERECLENCIPNKYYTVYVCLQTDTQLTTFFPKTTRFRDGRASPAMNAGRIFEYVVNSHIREVASAPLGPVGRRGSHSHSPEN